MTTVRARIESGATEDRHLRDDRPDNWDGAFYEKDNLLAEWRAGNLIPADELEARIAEAVAAERAKWLRPLRDMERLLGEFYGYHDWKNKPCGDPDAECPICMEEWIEKGDREAYAAVNALLDEYGRYDDDPAAAIRGGNHDG